MKSSVYYACVVAIASVATMALGAIVTEGDWDGVEFGDAVAFGDWWYSGIYSNSDGTDWSSYGAAEGYDSAYTTVAGQFSWTCTLYTYAEADIWLWDDEYCAAGADASASGYGPGWSGSVDAEAQISGSGTNGEHLRDTDSESDYGSGTASFDAYEGVDANHGAAAGTAVQPGSDDYAYAHADVSAYVSLY
jgi:hypothetical protein